ncbi:MAG: hypothetical protein ACI9IA_000222 [Enterobacterales bacterium]|jgi:hypothetical protein
MEEKNIETLLKLVKALDEMVELGELVLEDGKVNMLDVIHLPKIAPIVQSVYDVWKDKGELLLEAKDLSWEEIKLLINEVTD